VLFVCRTQGRDLLVYHRQSTRSAPPRYFSPAPKADTCPKLRHAGRSLRGERGIITETRDGSEQRPPPPMVGVIQTARWASSVRCSTRYWRRAHARAARRSQLTTSDGEVFRRSRHAVSPIHLELVGEPVRQARTASRSGWCGGTISFNPRCHAIGTVAKTLRCRARRQDSSLNHAVCSRIARKPLWSVMSPALDRRCGRSRKGDPRCCRTSQPKPSSRWRMRGSLANYVSAPRRSAN